MPATATPPTDHREMRRCHASDLPALMQALRSVYPHNPRLGEEAYLEWQYSPASGESEAPYQIWLDWRNGAINGWIGWVPVVVSHEGETHNGCYLQNWHTCSRDGSGLALFEQAAKPYAVRLMLGTTAEANRLYTAMKIPLLVAMPRWVAFSDPERARAIFGIQPGPDAALVQASHEALSRALHTAPNSTKWSDEMTAASYCPPPAYGVKNGIVRSRAWLEWRYRQIPEHRYTTLVSDNGELAVYRTEKITGHPVSVVRILEWMVTEQHAASALDEILHRTRADSVVMLDFSCTSTVIATGLVCSGFAAVTQFTPGSIPALFRPLNPGQPISLAIDFPPYRTARNLQWEKWYITRGDADLDRRKL